MQGRPRKRSRQPASSRPVYDIKEVYLERASATTQKPHKSIKENGDEASNKAPRLLGVNGPTEIIKGSIGDMHEPKLEGQPRFLAHSVQDAIRAVVELRTRIGAARMNVVTKGQEFIRCVYGTTGTKVQIVVASVCQECGHAPKYDCDYIMMYKCGSKSG